MSGSTLAVAALAVGFYVAAKYCMVDAPPGPRDMPVFVLVSAVLVASGRLARRWLAKSRSGDVP